MTQLIEFKDFTENNTYNVTTGRPTDSNSIFCLDNLSDVTIRNCSFSGGRQWTVKLSNCRNITFANCSFMGGYERAVDVVRGSNIVFINCQWITHSSIRPLTTSKWSLKKQCDVGIKGGVQDVQFIDCMLTDVLLGDYNIYTKTPGISPTRGISFDNCSSVIVRVWDGVEPHFENTPHQYNKWPSMLTSVYFWWARHFGDTRTPINNVG